ncbi:MAG: NIPSNAP family protein [Alphaproteobacteria bacterium]
MIFEVRTYRLKPRGVPEFIDTFGKAYEKRKSLSRIAAFFHTEIGPLNEVIHIWPYKDGLDREKKRVTSVKNKKYAWPPKVGHLQEHMQSEIFVPSPFTPEFPKNKVGPIFEWREYTLIPGMIAELYKNWEKAIPKRIEMSPLVMAMHTDLGGLNKFVHIWGYESLEHRAEVRAEAAAKGIWPPKGRRETLQIQANKICFTTPFSPLQ